MGSEFRWDCRYDELDFIEVYGEIISYITICSLTLSRSVKAQEGEYIAADYMPTTEKSTDGMYEELLGYIKKVENQYLRQVSGYYFVKDETFIRNFKGTFRCEDGSSWIRRRTSGTYIKCCEVL